MCAANRPIERKQDIMGAVMRMASTLGWKVYHTHMSLRSEPGCPDLVMTKPGQPVIYAELKRETGKLTVVQVFWRESLKLVQGTEGYCWRPADWPAIEQRLRG